ncbi:helix-turn-helix domain-containing protein [Microbacterium sp. NIBRBAC000506063]|uniref:helix-turn-helix domain-containing protein n=1 Tax=Microbacterium sp. NIBRBAC000506063 TaxID=2734618 RepID=UPI001BB7C37B|nr:helix-turn-helix domain-containing protein [Microbacterium sp. NIBRBAC000506063]
MQTTHAQDRRIGVTEAARISGFSIDTIRRAADSGKLNHTRTPGGQRRFLVDDVLALAEGGEQS